MSDKLNFSKHLYVVYDSVAESVSGPLLSFVSDAVAIRSFSDVVRAPNSVLAQHPDDFVLLRIGTLQEQIPEVFSEPEPLVIMRARTIVDLDSRDQDGE